MTSRTDKGRDGHLSRLAEIVEAYGADESRWPPEERAALAGLRDGVGPAGKALREEAALDRLLDAVPAPVPPKGSVDRILRAAAASGRSAGPSADIIPMTPRPVAPRAQTTFSGLWPSAAGLIAASLMLGLVAGASPYSDIVFPGFYDPAISDDRTAEEYMVDLLLFDLVEDEDGL